MVCMKSYCMFAASTAAIQNQSAYIKNTSIGEIQNHKCPNNVIWKSANGDQAK